MTARVSIAVFSFEFSSLEKRYEPRERRRSRDENARKSERKKGRKKERKEEGREERERRDRNGSEGERSRAFTVITRRRGCIRAHCIGNDFAPN